MYCLGLPAFAAVGVLTRTFYALGETRVPVQASFVSVALNLGLNLLFIGPLRSLGLEVVNIGPWGRDAHGLCERVYAPYAFETLPRLIAEIARETLAG